MITLGALLYAAGGAIFCVLGTLHAVYMLMDLRRPRRLVPSDLALIAAMAGSRVRLAGDATDMWHAWIGFNLSHSLGALLFGATAIAWPGVAAGHAALAWLPAAVAALYLAIGLRFWFSVPNAGIAAAMVAFAAAALLG
jgi:hypothetical protein